MPVWLLTLCMTVANYRLTRLITKDDFPPVLWLRDRLAGGWRPLTLAEHERYGAASPSAQAVIRDAWSYDPEDGLRQRYVMRSKRSPYWLAELVSCPWCVSGWTAAVITAAVDLTVGVPIPFLVWGAVWGASALTASREWA